MAVRGAEAKSYITEGILSKFPGSFLVDGKELRIPYDEGGNLVQIKVALTAAKENVEPPEGMFDEDEIEIPSSGGVGAEEGITLTQNEQNLLERAVERLGLI